MTNLRKLDQLPVKPVWEGVDARIVQGDRITMSVVELEPDRLVPEHQHPNEQIGMVISGTITFRVGEETSDLGPGGTWRILGNVPHEARAGNQGAIVVEVFSPIRADWEEIENTSPRRPKWPASESGD